MSNQLTGPVLPPRSEFDLQVDAYREQYKAEYLQWLKDRYGDMDEIKKRRGVSHTDPAGDSFAPSEGTMTSAPASAPYRSYRARGGGFRSDPTGWQASSMSAGRGGGRRGGRGRGGGRGGGRHGGHMNGDWTTENRGPAQKRPRDTS